MRYRRCLEGNCYFFTVVTFNRRPLFADTHLVDRLRMAFGHVRQKAPFSMPAFFTLMYLPLCFALRKKVPS